MTRDGVAEQRESMEQHYADRADPAWAFHYTTQPLTRFLRDRRLHVALDVLRGHGRFAPDRQKVLVACGGVGGEGTFLANQGFTDVTVSDLSENALDSCRRLDPRLKTARLNAEAMDVADDSFDLVFVQDGLHHLPRPALGLTEMLRVAREAVVVIEPHVGLVGKVLGTEWERHGDAVNYVYRWSKETFTQTVRSYLLTADNPIVVRRFWDHNLAVGKAVKWLPERRRSSAARAIYAMLRPVSGAGNMFVGVAFKSPGPPPPRLASH